MANWSCFGSYSWSKLPGRGAVAPGRDQHRLRSWPGPTGTHVAKKYHPRSEISDSFPSPSSSVKLSPLLMSLYFKLWGFTGHFHGQCQLVRRRRKGVFPYTADESPLPARRREGCSAQQQQNIPQLASS